MRRTRTPSFTRAAAVVGASLFALALAGCGSTASSFCERANECNALAAGQSVDECTEQTERNLDDLTSGQRSDCESAINDCLDLDACGNFVACVANLPC